MKTSRNPAKQNHCAALEDVHLGHFHTAAAMERLAERVNALAPDMVVITGDLFDGMIDGLPGFAEPLKRLSARKGVYFVTGNHEVYAGLRRSLDVVARADIRVLFNEVVEIDGLSHGHRLSGGRG